MSRPSSSSQTGHRPAKGLVRSRSTPRVKPVARSVPEIKFCRQDITEFTADVIICPVSSSLSGSAGIAGAILKKAGTGLAKFHAEKRKEYKNQLPVGEAIVSPSYGLRNCRFIIHVVVPRLSSYKDDRECSEDLKKAFDSSFRKLKEVLMRNAASREMVHSVAVPALGAGTNKIPKDIVAQIMCRSINEFMNTLKNSELRLERIYIVSTSEEMLSILENVWIADSKIDLLSGSKSTGRGRVTQLDIYHKKYGNKLHLDKNNNSSKYISSSSVAYTKINGSKERPDKPVFYPPPEYHSEDAAYNRKTANSTFFSPPGLGPDQSSDRQRCHDSAVGFSYKNSKCRDMVRTSSIRDDSDDDFDSTDGFSKPPKNKIYETMNLASSQDNRKRYDSSKALSPRGVRSASDYGSCPICFDDLTGDAKSLPVCGHKVCKDCWIGLQSHNPVCPVCRKVYGTLRGIQPKNAKMTSRVDPSIHLPGYEPFSTIVIDYNVPDGVQTDEHPNPGKPYKGTRRTAYLPDSRDGAKVLGLLQRAFEARLTFTIGQSVTSGQEDVVTWNDIHHKTNISGPRYGYPDATYLMRVKEELESKGIK